MLQEQRNRTSEQMNKNVTRSKDSDFSCLKQTISQSLVCLILISVLGCSTHQKPNVVLFLVDDLGWTDLSSYGSTLYQTPNADQLAADGIKFTDAYAACTVCSPTRASILTGKHPAHINTTDWIAGHQRPFAKLKVPEWTQHIREEDVTLAEALKGQGYSTIHIGKWHLGEEEKYWPEHHGFDTNIGGWKMGMPKRVKKVGGYFSPYHNPRLTDGLEGEYLTERLADEAVSFINQNDDKPFFLNFWLYNVHTPLQAKEELITKYDSLVDPNALHSNATYAAMVEHMDQALGKVVAQLKVSGIYDNTIIVFASDNGGLIGNKGDLSKKPKVTSNYPLKAGKGHKYEGGVRVPFLVSWPGHITANQTSDVLSSSIDIFPTLFGLLGIKEALPTDIDGTDLSALLIGGEEPESEVIYWHYPHYHTEGATPYSAVRKGDWKLILNYENDSLELFNLKQDIGESNNVASDYPEKAKELEEILTAWKQKMGAQEPIVNPDYDSAKQRKWKSNW